MPFVTQRTFSARVVLAFRGTLAPEFGWLHKSSPTLPGHGGEVGGGPWDQCGQTGRRARAAPPCPPGYLSDEGPMDAGISHPIDNVASVSRGRWRPLTLAHPFFVVSSFLPSYPFFFFLSLGRSFVRSVFRWFFRSLLFSFFVIFTFLRLVVFLFTSCSFYYNL